MSQAESSLVPESPIVLERREFCACALALTAAACSGGGGGAAPSPGGGNPPPPANVVTTTDTKAGLLAQAAGTVRDYTTAAGSCPGAFGAAQGYYLIRDDKGIFSISASCLHQGGRIQHVSGGFNCPCHGSTYNDDGKVTGGPAPIGQTLAHYEVRESTPGGVLVIDPAKVVSESTRLS
jgi:Rieske Fe-S protein